MSNKVFFSATTQYENLGDGIIGRELINLMRPKGHLIIDDRHAPKWYSDLIGVKSTESVISLKSGFKRQLIWNSLKSVFTKDCIYWALKPGHHYGGHNLPREIVYTGLLVFLRILGVKIVRYGASVGPYYGFYLVSEKIKAIVMKDYTVRDRLSQSYCENHNIQPVRFFPDLAFQLHYENNLTARQYRIGLSFRESILSESEVKVTSELEQILEKLCQTYSNKESFICVSQVQRDDEFMSRLNKKLDIPHSVKFFELSKASGESIFSLYSNMEILLSNRLHALIFAASRGVIPIPVIDKKHHLKIVGIYQDEGLDDLIFDIYGEIELSEHIAQIKSQSDSWLHKIRSIFQKYNGYSI